MIILLVGPDGAGKSTVASLLRSTLTVTRHEHFRPYAPVELGVPEQPHGDAARSLPTSIAKVLFLWGEQSLRVGARKKASRRGVVLIERGWWDQAVDPRRYRIHPMALPLVRAMGRTFPKADVGVLLTADPRVIHTRKPELSVLEIQRQADAWWATLPYAASRTYAVDATADPRASTADIIRRLEL